MKHTLSDLRPNDLVKQIGLSPSYASELLARKKSPSLDIALRVERQFGIPPAAWMEKTA